MRGQVRHSVLFRMAAFAILAMSCQDPQSPVALRPDPDTVIDPPPPPPPQEVLAALIVSEPTSPPSPSGSPSAAGHSTNFGPVYVSLPPGSIPEGDQITVMSRATGARITSALEKGGLDPLPVEAAESDTLDLEITLIGGTDTLYYISLVPLRRPPVVVRADPPPAKRDVPLNSVLILVFSEPIKSSTLTNTSVQLLQGGVPVPGSLAFADPENVVVVFTPAAPLAFATDYTLIATGELEDLNGEPLQATVSIAFSTETTPEQSPGQRIAFSSDREGANHIYIVNPDGSDLVKLGQGAQPAWSWDGRRIAFTAASLDGTSMDVVVMDDDGSNKIRLGEGWTPGWSPDGSQIAFSVDTAIMVMNANGSNRRTLINLQIPGIPPGSNRIWNPVWSPDGRSITFDSRGGSSPPYEQVFVMNADGSNPRAISTDTWTKQSPAWSPDGRQITVFTWDDIPGFPGNVDNVLAVYDLATGQRTIHHRPHMLWLSYGLDLSPDGRHVAMTQYVYSIDTYGFRILILDFQTGSVRSLLPDAVNPVNPNYFDMEPTWSRR